ncbi:hypothetical protein N9Y26_01295 [bacterium]|nr:hypothetical protein [bacterium]
MLCLFPLEGDLNQHEQSTLIDYLPLDFAFEGMFSEVFLHFGVVEKAFAKSFFNKASTSFVRALLLDQEIPSSFDTNIKGLSIIKSLSTNLPKES